MVRAQVQRPGARAAEASRPGRPKPPGQSRRLCLRRKPNSVRRRLSHGAGAVIYLALTRYRYSAPAVAANRPPADATITQGFSAWPSGQATQPSVLSCTAGVFHAPILTDGPVGSYPAFSPLPGRLLRQTGRYLFCDTIRHLPAWAGKCPPFRTACCLMVFGLSSAEKGTFLQRPPATGQDHPKCARCNWNATNSVPGNG